jgi:two-component SAPR family response regulator
MTTGMIETMGNALQGRRILIVEDDYLIASDLADALQELGAIILGPCSSVRAALRLISETKPDTAVLDINLGQQNAYPIADALLADGMPFIFVTGYSSDVLPAQYRGIPRCQKPLQNLMIGKLLGEALARYTTFTAQF